MVNATTSLQELFDMAVHSLADVETGETFSVKDLFRGFEWNRIARGDRTRLGGMMLNYAGGDGASVLEPVAKTPQNQQIYKKL